MANKVNICFICGGVASDRWKVRPHRYICEDCYRRLFKPQEGTKQNVGIDKDKQ